MKFVLSFLLGLALCTFLCNTQSAPLFSLFAPLPLPSPLDALLCHYHNLTDKRPIVDHVSLCFPLLSFIFGLLLSKQPPATFALLLPV